MTTKGTRFRSAQLERLLEVYERRGGDLPELVHEVSVWATKIIEHDPKYRPRIMSILAHAALEAEEAGHEEYSDALLSIAAGL